MENTMSSPLIGVRQSVPLVKNNSGRTDSISDQELSGIKKRMRARNLITDSSAGVFESSTVVTES